jgi:hypothetical protein
VNRATTRLTASAAAPLVAPVRVAEGSAALATPAPPGAGAAGVHPQPGHSRRPHDNDHVDASASLSPCATTSISSRGAPISTRLKKSVLGGIALAAVSVLAMSTEAVAAGVAGTATITGGTLTMNAPSTLAFGSASLASGAQTMSATQGLDVVDLTGSGAGWNVTLTSTTFTSGANLLPVASATDFSTPTGACDSVGACTIATNSISGYPLVVPAAGSAPTAIKIQNAALNTGLVGQTWTHTMHLAIPANARAGTYTSTWTYSIVSAP